MKQILVAVALLALLCACAGRSVSTPASSVPVPPSPAPSASEPPAPVSSTLEPISPVPEPAPIDESWALVLVNNWNGLGQDFAPVLTEVQNGYQVDERVAPALRLMLNDAKDAGIELVVCSAFRPYERQERNYNASIQNYITEGYSEADALAMTQAYIAMPGFSEHQTGLAVDIITPTYIELNRGFAETDAAKWMAEHAPEYGFILRYPKDKTAVTGIAYEPWHFRYVGETAAKEITEAGLCLEEYLAS